MAATKGNQFWMKRTKHGVDRLFKDGATLQGEAVKFFTWCEKNPLYEYDYHIVKGKQKHIRLPKMRPFTMKGLCIYLGISESYFREFKRTADEKKDQGFLTVIEWIEDVVYTQKFSGAAAGFFNANIIARDLGLKEGMDVTSKGEKLKSPTAIVSILNPHE